VEDLLEPLPSAFGMGDEKEIRSDVERGNVVLRRVLSKRRLVKTEVHLGRRLKQRNWMMFA
jgi:hypothetical protein